MKRVAVAVVLLALLGVAACGDNEPEPPAVDVPEWAFDRGSERHAVMRVILTEEYGKAAKRFVLNPELVEGVRLPSDRTIAKMRAKGLKLPESLELPGGRRVRAPTIDGLDARLIADWAAHGTPSPTPKDLDLPLPIDWFTEVDWDALKGVVVTGELAHDHPKWQAFHVTYPDSAGWISLSDVGFSPNGDQALVYAAVSSGSLSGVGRWYLLERRNGRWTIVKQKRAWVS